VLAGYGKAIHAEHPELERLLRGARVLLVEDNIINQQVAQEILRQAGMSVDVAANGVEAVRAVQETSYDAVLMDVQMPEMDGYEATRRIRTDPRFQNLPIIAMTAHSMKGARERCLESGMNDHVPKPIDSEQLFNTLVSWIRPDADAGSEAAPAAPPICVPEAMARIGGNMKLARKLVTIFCQDYEDAANKIGALLAAGHRATAERMAHSVKGAAASLAARELSDKAADLEAVINEGSAPSAECFAAFESALRRAILFGREWLVRIDAGRESGT
jgi:two-component system sensor histidine kinase/response regulator